MYGRIVREVFEKRYGVCKHGEEKLVGEKWRTIYLLRHPEHTWCYANVKQLQELRKSLEQMAGDSMTEINFKWVDELIEARRLHKTMPTPKRSTKPSPVTSEGLQKAISRFEREVKAPGRRQTEAERQRRSKQRLDPNGPYKNVSKLLKQAHADPNGPWKDISAKMKKLHADPDGPWKNLSEDMKQRHADPNGPFQGTSARVKKAWAEGLYDDSKAERATNRSRTDIATRHANLSRWKPSSEAPVFMLSYCDPATALPPRASTITHDDLIFHVRGAMAFLGIRIPSHLEKPRDTKARPLGKKGQDPRAYNYDWLRTPKDDSPQGLMDSLLERSIPQPQIEDHPSFVMRFNAWKKAKRLSFAEDVYLYAQSKGVRGTEALYTPKTGAWTWGLEEDE